MFLIKGDTKMKNLIIQLLILMQNNILDIISFRQELIELEDNENINIITEIITIINKRNLK